MAEGYGNSEGFRPRPPRQNQFPVIADDIVVLSEKVYFPIDEYPGYNFMGKLIGPKGTTLKSLVLSTKTKISILGKGSSKDKAKEEELAKSDDPDHAHYKEPLHVLVQVKAPKIAAHRRMSTTLKKLNHYMVPQRDERLLDERPPMSQMEIRKPFGRERPAPIIRVGVPPPGAVIVGEEREGRRGDAPDGYYERRDSDFNRYPEPRDYPADRDSYRPAENRSVPPSNGYSPKRYRDDTYDDPYAR